MTTRAASALSRASFTYSLRRSCVSSGIVARTTVPSFPTVAPRCVAATIAFSMSLSEDLSNGVMSRTRASWFCREASWASDDG